jgi:hypothetical protein
MYYLCLEWDSSPRSPSFEWTKIFRALNRAGILMSNYAAHYVIFDIIFSTYGFKWTGVYSRQHFVLGPTNSYVFRSVRNKVLRLCIKVEPGYLSRYSDGIRFNDKWTGLRFRSWLRGFFSSPKHRDQFQCSPSLLPNRWVPGALPRGYSRQVVRLMIHLYLMLSF